MSIFFLLLQVLAAFSGGLVALLSGLLFFRLHWPAPVWWFLKLFTSALSPLFVIVGVFCVLVGLISGPAFITWIGIYNVIIFGIHLFIVTKPPDTSSGFEQAFGSDWENRINEGLKKYFLPGRRTFKLPGVPDPLLQQNVVFAVIPETGRTLLCDVWQPPSGIKPSGLALIYLHGGAWYLLDKDAGTRPFFTQLAARGHVIMDVAYRLAPETDMMGMVNDVQRAIVWLKENAATYKINPERIIAGGGSAGAHLALLTAYTADNPQFTATGIKEKDFSVRAVISLYGPTDLEAMYYHTNQNLTTRSTPGKSKMSVPTQIPRWIIKKMGQNYYRLGMNKSFEQAVALAPLMKGHPDECPQTFARFSPITHVHSGCPPTLLIHGEHDVMAPVKTTRLLFARLKEKKVTTVMQILPQSDHAFDLPLFAVSPAAHNALYNVERFMALMV